MSILTLTAMTLLAQRLGWRSMAKDAPSWVGGPSRAEFVEGLLRPTDCYVEYMLPESLKGSRVNTTSNLVALFRCIDRDTTLEPTPKEKVGTAYQVSRDYFTVEVPQEFRAFRGATPMSLILRGKLDQVRVVDGKDELEFQLKREFMQTPLISLISNMDGLMRWHAGPLLPLVDHKCLLTKVTHPNGDVKITILGAIKDEDLPKVRVLGDSQYLHVHTNNEYKDNPILYRTGGPELENATVNFVA